MDPDGCTLSSHLGDLGREALIDSHIRVPPGAVELGRNDHIVIERPESCIGESFIIFEDILTREGDGNQMHAVDGERVEINIGHPGPADPRTLLRLHHRSHGSDQTPR